MEEREEMVRGRSLESKGWSLESSQRANLVNIRSSNSSVSASDFAAVAAAGDDDDSAIFSSFFSFFFLSQQDTYEKRLERNVTESCFSFGFYGVLLCFFTSFFLLREFYFFGEEF